MRMFCFHDHPRCESYRKLDYCQCVRDKGHDGMHRTSGSWHFTDTDSVQKVVTFVAKEPS